MLLKKVKTLTGSAKLLIYGMRNKFELSYF